jgi:hypothetical protein
LTASFGGNSGISGRGADSSFRNVVGGVQQRRASSSRIRHDTPLTEKEARDFVSIVARILVGDGRILIWPNREARAGWESVLAKTVFGSDKSPFLGFREIVMVSAPSSVNLRGRKLCDPMQTHVPVLYARRHRDAFTDAQRGPGDSSAGGCGSGCGRASISYDLRPTDATGLNWCLNVSGAAVGRVDLDLKYGTSVTGVHDVPTSAMLPRVTLQGVEYRWWEDSDERDDEDDDCSRIAATIDRCDWRPEEKSPHALAELLFRYVPHDRGFAAAVQGHAAPVIVDPFAGTASVSLAALDTGLYVVLGDVDGEVLRAGVARLYLHVAALLVDGDLTGPNGQPVDAVERHALAAYIGWAHRGPLSDSERRHGVKARQPALRYHAIEDTPWSVLPRTMPDHVMRLANNQHVVFPGRQPEQYVQPVPQRMLQQVPRMYARLI